MTYLCLLLTIVASCNIIISKGSKRILVFLFSFIFLRNNLYVIENPGISAHFFILFAYVYSLFLHDELQLNWRKMPFKAILFFLSFLLLVLGVLTKKFDLFHKIYYPITLIINDLLPLFIGFSFIKNTKEFCYVTKIVSVIAVLASIYGLWVYWIQFNPYDFLTAQIRGSSYTDFLLDSDLGRGIRLNSICATSHEWGLLCAFFLFFYIHFFRIKHGYRLLSFVGLILIVGALFLSKSRSSIVSAVLGILVMLLLIKSLKKKILILIGCASIFFVFVYNGWLDVSFITDAFAEGGGETGGSDIVLRQKQFNSALYYFYQNPLFGMGLDYFHSTILKSYQFDIQEMGGFESDLYIWMIERGLIYIILSIVFIIQVFRFFLVKGGLGNVATILGLSIWCAYWFNAFATGSAGKTVYAFFFLGVCLKMIYIINDKNESYNFSRRFG